MHAGGNAVTVDNVSLNLTDTGSLLAAARASAVKDAKAKATQFARALGEPLGQVVSITPDDQSRRVSSARNASAGQGASPCRSRQAASRSASRSPWSTQPDAGMRQVGSAEGVQLACYARRMHADLPAAGWWRRP